MKSIIRRSKVTFGLIAIGVILLLLQRVSTGINEPPCDGPAITLQPQSQTTCEGQAVNFTAAASGTPTPTVQWYVRTNGVGMFQAIIGETNQTLTFTAMAVHNGNWYKALFHNCGSVFSSNATLTVCTVAPSISSQPTNQTVCLGQSASFSVAASGSSLSYLWRKSVVNLSNGGSVSDATTATLTLSNITTNDGGASYSVVVSNACGTQTSSAAILGFSAPCDGIPDWWRQQYFGDTTINSNSCAACDPDEDGLSNLSEFECGTDPLLPNRITAPFGVCRNSVGNSASVPDLSTGASYSWSITNGALTTGQNTREITWTASTNGPVVLTVSMTTGVGCIIAATNTVTVYPLPVCSIAGPSSVSSMSISNSYSATAGMSSYSWTMSGNGTIAAGGNAQTVIVDAGASNTFTLAVLITNSNGCSSSCSNTVTTCSMPPVSITVPSAVCAGYAGNPASIALPFTTLYSFAAGDPKGLLIQSTNGNFYGTTYVGGTNNFGTVFKITPAGTLTILGQFGGVSTVGRNPYAGLLESTNGNFYGTTYIGGTNNLGTVFKITPDGTLTTLGQFGGPSTVGRNPHAGLLEGSDGNFYGTTFAGGTNNFGTVFKITPNGTLTTLGQFGGPSTVGRNPYAGLIQGSDGNFYGTTYIGGTNSVGTVFKITPDGTLTTLGQFGSGSTAGRNPYAGLIQGSDGNFYGTTYAGGINTGTVFQITPAGTLTTLYRFGNTDGNKPYAGLYKGSDGDLYGTTEQGGTNNHGTVFKISSAYNTYNWSITNGTLTAGQGSREIIWTAGSSSPATLCATVISPTGCSVDICTNVTINSNPDCSVSGPNAVCSASTGNIYTGPSGGGLSYIWTISGNGTISGVSTAQTVSVNATTSGSFTLGLKVTIPGSGCSSSCSKAVTVNITPTCSISGAGTVCAYSSLTYTGASGSGLSYSWTINGNGTITGVSTAQTVSVNATTSGSFTLGLTARTAACTSTCSKAVTVNDAIPAAPIAGNNGPICVAQSLNLTASTISNATYTWTGPIGFTSSSQNPSIQNATTDASGIYCVAATVGGCISTQGCVSVTVKPLPSATVTGTTNILSGSSATIQAALTGTPNWIVTWSDGVITTNTSSPAIRNVSPSSTTTYTVTAVSDTNCTGMTSGSAIVSASLITGPTAVCSLSTGNRYLGFPSMASYNWTISGNGTITGASDQQTVYVTAGISNSFTLAVSIVNTNGISTNDTYAIAINPPELPVSIQLSGNQTCATSIGNAASLPGPHVLTALYSFIGSTNGANPYAGLTRGSDGYLYGTTIAGGPSGVGTIFKISPSGTLTTLCGFLGTNGAQPYGVLQEGSDGNFYGTTKAGGIQGAGTVFKVSPAGALTRLFSFSSPSANGQNPLAGVVQGSDGNFYGTTALGAAGGYGTVFKITLAGTLTTLRQFGSGGTTNGVSPQGGLVEGSDGNFYGTASSGGANWYGTIFKISPSGTLTLLYGFTGGADGRFPYAGLVRGSDGNFYGTTTEGGTNNNGTVFRITPVGTLTTLYHFPANNNFDGAHPEGQLVEGSDGNFYGTTPYGGITGFGTLFRISPAGTYSLLHRFTSGTDGKSPHGSLVQGNDGYLYGVAPEKGANDKGTIFRINPTPGSYSWSITNGTITSGQDTWSITWKAGTNSPATLCLTVTNAMGCMAVMCTNVTINPAPLATITAPSSVIVGSTTNTASVPNAGAQAGYIWYVQNGLILNGQGTTNITWLGFLNPAILSVYVTSPSLSCPALSSVSVTVNDVPTPTPSSNGPICEGQTLTLSASASIGATYHWTGPNGFASTFQNPSVDNAVPADSGQYCVTVVANGFSSAPACISVTVNPLPDPTITTPAAVCINSTNNTASVSSAGTGATYNWSITKGTMTAGQGTSNLIWTAGPTGPVTLGVIVTSGAGCSTNSSLDVTVVSPADLALAVPLSVCANSTNNVASVPETGVGSSYTWSISNGSITSGQNTPTIMWSAGAEGTCAVDVSVNTVAGCSTSSSTNIAVNSLPACSITGPDLVTSNSAGNVYIGPVESGLTYSWDVTGNATIDGSSWNQSVHVNVGNSGSFTLTLTLIDEGGCNSTCTKTVVIGGGSAPVAWWRFDEGTGTNVFDSSGNGNTGVLEGDPRPTWTNGVSSNALLFDGVQNRVRVPDNAVLSPTNVITVAAWIKSSPATNGVIVSKWASDGSDGSYRLSLWQGQVVFQLFVSGASVSVTGATVVADTNWHHVTGIYDGAQVRVYLDGAVDGSAVATGTIDVVNAAVSFGQAADGHGFPGRITDIRLYSRVLAQSEVGGVFNTDTDSDGIPDWWMQFYFGHPTGLASDNSRATDDYDGDGVNNLTAYREGRDPTNGPAVPGIGGIADLEVFTPLE